MSRVQLSLNVADIDDAVAFYSKLFGARPAKRRSGYADFALAEPPLKLVLLENSAGRGDGVAGVLNHLGVEVETPEEVRAATRRLSGEGLDPDGKASTSCYYAVDPDGALWEVCAVPGQPRRASISRRALTRLLRRRNRKTKGDEPKGLAMVD